MFIAALFTIVKLWKQSKYPSIDEWIKKAMLHIYNGILENEIVPFATAWVDLEGIVLSEISQSEKEKYHMISLICRICRTK